MLELVPWQGQSDTGRNPRPFSVPWPLQKHDTKAPFTSKMKLPAAECIFLKDLPKPLHIKLKNKLEYTEFVDFISYFYCMK